MNIAEALEADGPEAGWFNLEHIDQWVQAWQTVTQSVHLFSQGSALNIHVL